MQEIKERLVAVEITITDHSVRLEKIEKREENKQAEKIKNMWSAIKLLSIATIITLLTEKAKDRWQIIGEFFRGFLGS